jgi:PPP family 3-phenylpropionic acid transporter
VLQRHGLGLLFPIYGAVTVVVLLITVTTRPQKRIARPEDHELAATVSAGRSLRAVFTNGRYLVLVASCFFVLLGTRSALVFLPLRLYALGGTTIHVGWAQAVSAGSEMPFMFLSVFVLRRVRPRLLLLGAMVFFVVRLVFVRLAATPGALVAVQAIQGISVGFLLPAVIHYIDRISPPEYRSLFQTLAPAIYFGLASVVGSSAGGLIIERFGLDALYTVSPIVSS